MEPGSFDQCLLIEQEASWKWCWVNASEWPWLSRESFRWPPEVPFQRQPFCDSMISKKATWKRLQFIGPMLVIDGSKRIQNKESGIKNTSL